MKGFRFQSATALAGFALVAIPTGAFAQSAAGDTKPRATTPAADAEATIIVTGSRIPRPNLDRDQPTTIVPSAIIDQRGFTTAATALNQLPGFGIAAVRQ